MNDFNAAIIEEFRTHGGRVGGPFEGAQLLLLTSTGAKSGQPRTTPVVYLEDGENLVIFASKAGAPTDPAWYRNLLADPSASVEVGTDTLTVRARVAEGEERERLYARQVARMPQFADYQAKTTRRIPVVVLERAG
ncbi:MAG TPA: nitroreductase family deazaflavin-dependent oxidoreductase [Solirubrobacteraceae bacterium]|nr:nitroreductase family deazaflavin-dependent oxidoreductase [Solirubrobacteraceae bacterium]